MIDLIKYGLLALVFWVVITKIIEGIRDSAPRHCMTCGTDADPKRVTKGSILIEVVLWLCFIVPGVLYSLWRLTTKATVCRACNASNIVPMDSPAAVNHRRQLTGGPVA